MAYIRSAIYLLGFGTVGYCLMQLVTPNESEISQKILEGRGETKNELLKKRQAFVDVLKSAAEGQDPLYRKTKEEIEKSLKR